MRFCLPFACGFKKKMWGTPCSLKLYRFSSSRATALFCSTSTAITLTSRFNFSATFKQIKQGGGRRELHSSVNAFKHARARVCACVCLCVYVCMCLCVCLCLWLWARLCVCDCEHVPPSLSFPPSPSIPRCKAESRARCSPPQYLLILRCKLLTVAATDSINLCSDQETGDAVTNRPLMRSAKRGIPPNKTNQWHTHTHTQIHTQDRANTFA